MGRRLTGSVRPHGDRFIARVGEEYLGLFATEAEGWRACKAFIALHDQHGLAKDVLGVYGAEWLDDREVAGHVRGIDNERSLWNMHVASAFFADWPMRRIKPMHIQRWLGELLDKEAVSAIRDGEGGVKRRPLGRKLSRKAVANTRTVLKQCFEQARIEGRVSENPVVGVPLPKVDRVIEDEETWAFLTVEEIDALFDILPTARFKAFFAIAIYSGLRDGEIIGLRWQNVVLEGDAPHLKVRRSYNGPLKTRRSRRDVPLLRPAREALRRWRHEVRQGLVVSADGLVFPADHGGCLHKGYDADWSDRKHRDDDDTLIVTPGWKTKAGIRAHVRFHDLRHTCGSHLAMGTWGRAWKPHEIMVWLGHTDIRTTLIYAELSPDNIHGKAREMESNPKNDPNRRKINATPGDDDTRK